MEKQTPEKGNNEIDNKFPTINQENNEEDNKENIIEQHQNPNNNNNYINNEIQKPENNNNTNDNENTSLNNNENNQNQAKKTPQTSNLQFISQTPSLPLQVNAYENHKYYENLTKDGIINKQRADLVKLSTSLISMEKENSELRKRIAHCDHFEKEVQRLTEVIDIKEKEHETVISNYKAEIKSLIHKINELKHQQEIELDKYKQNISSFHQKMDYINHVELENKVNKEIIDELKTKLETLQKDSNEQLRIKEIHNQIKYSQLKKKMVDNLQETKANVTKLNMEYMDVSNKLTLLQNHQLIVQIEFQAQKIEELNTLKEQLEKKIFELEKDLEIYKEVGTNLAQRIKNIENNKNLQINKANNNNEQSNNKHLLLKLLNRKSINEPQNLSTHSVIDRKLPSTDKVVKSLKEENEKLRIQIDALKQKVNLYERKYSGLYNYFEDCLNLFFEDEVLKGNKDLYIHIDQIKRCDFSLFNTDEKYALLVLIMKYLLPLVTLNVNASCNIGNTIFKTNLNLINRRFNSTEKYLNDKVLRQAFLGKNNKLNNNLGKSRTLSVFSNSIPVLRKTQSNLDKRFLDPKYQAVF